MKKIPLSQGKYAVVDDDDFEYLNQFKWCAQKIRNTYYVVRAVRKNGKSKHIYMHIEILGKKDGCEIDHKDRDGLNNQRNNIRHVTARQNMNNRNILKTSKYPGVHWDKDRQKWRATMWVGGVYKYIGRYSNEYDAFLAYKNALVELGEEVV